MAHYGFPHIQVSEISNIINSTVHESHNLGLIDQKEFNQAYLRLRREEDYFLRIIVRDIERLIREEQYSVEDRPAERIAYLAERTCQRPDDFPDYLWDVYRRLLKRERPEQEYNCSFGESMFLDLILSNEIQIRTLERRLETETDARLIMVIRSAISNARTRIERAERCLE